jgi:hypothetical protein
MLFVLSNLCGLICRLVARKLNFFSAMRHSRMLLAAARLCRRELANKGWWSKGSIVTSLTMSAQFTKEPLIELAIERVFSVIWDRASHTARRMTAQG